MKRNVFVAVAVALLMSVPAWAAPPFGSFGGLANGGNSGAGVLALHGWALDDNGVDSVDILVDGIVIGRAHYGRNRPQVQRQFPNFPDSAGAGFAFELNSTHFRNGLHTVTARVRSKTGEFTTLNSRALHFTNTQHSLAPFGKIEFPIRDAELSGACDEGTVNVPLSVVSGYALDSGLLDHDHGVAYVELLIDRSLAYNSRLDCAFSGNVCGGNNCYGIRRLDIERFFPGLKDSPHSGFRFALDVGELIRERGYLPGSHLLTIRAGDHAGQIRNIAEIPVHFSCVEDTPNESSFGEIEVPRPNMMTSGITRFSGWAIDRERVGQVFVLVDGQIVGLASYGQLQRRDLLCNYQSYPDAAAAPGWYFDLDTRRFSNGVHHFGVLVFDQSDDRYTTHTLIGERPFLVNNPTP